MIRTHLPLAALLLSVAAASSVAAPVAFVEDLSACSLPNALVTLPVPGTDAAAKGDALKLANGTLAPLSYTQEGKILTPAQILDQTRTSKSADLQFSPANDGTLWAFSGRISDLGYRTLAESATVKPDLPMTIPATSRGPEGALAPVREGHTYLIMATDDRFALLRVLEKGKEGLVFQYVYQPNGALQFDVPSVPLVPYRRPEAATAPAVSTRAAATAPAFTSRVPLGPQDRVEPGVIVLRGNPPPTTGPSDEAGMGNTTLQQHLRQRDMLIQRRLAALQATARSAGDIERKVSAAADLGALNAEEAVDLLVAQISFYNPKPTGGAFSQDALHPCFAALKKLGKPASLAALKGLRTLDPAGKGEGIDAPMYKAALLVNVIRAVEGDAVAEFLLTRASASETDPARKALYDPLPTPR